MDSERYNKHWLSLIVHCLLLIGYYSLVIAYCLMLIGYCLLVIAYGNYLFVQTGVLFGLSTAEHCMWLSYIEDCYLLASIRITRFTDDKIRKDCCVVVVFFSIKVFIIVRLNLSFYN